MSYGLKEDQLQWHPHASASQPEQHTVAGRGRPSCSVFCSVSVM